MVRAAGLALVLLGAVALGVYAFRYLDGGPAGGAWGSPVVAGIAVVGGLLVLAGTGRRE